MELVASQYGLSKTFVLPLVTFEATDWLSGVTLALGDVQIAKDGGGGYVNIPLSQLTVVVDHVIITLSDANMQFKYAIVRVKDQTGPKVFADTGAILTTDLRSWQQALFTLIESQRGSHTGVKEQIFWDPVNGSDAKSGMTFNEAKLTYNFNGANGVYSLLRANEHQIVHLLPQAGGAPTTVNEYIEVDTAYTFLRGPGRDFLIEATHNEACVVLASAEGIEFSGFRVKTKTTGSQDGICSSGDFANMRKIWVDYSRGSGIVIDNASSCILEDFLIQDSGQGGSGHALHILGDTSLTERNIIGTGRIFSNGNGGGGTDGIRIDGEFCLHNFITGGPGGLYIHDNTGYGIREVNDADETIIVGPTVHIGHNTLGDTPELIGEKSRAENWQQWATAEALAEVPTDPPVNIISALSGSISVDSVKDGGIVILYQNTAMAIPIDLGKDMSGRKIFFTAVRDLDDTEYSIPDGGTTPKEVTADFNLSTGEGLLSFTSEELNIATGTLEVEVHSNPDVGGDDVPELIFKIKLKDHPSNL